MKIDPYCHRQKCSPGILVFNRIRFMRIFAGVAGQGLQLRVGSSKMAIFASFARSIFRTFTYLRPQYFALKSVSELAFLAFGQKCSTICRATHYILSICQRQKCSPEILSSKVGFVRIFAGVRWRGALNEGGIVENGNFYFFRSVYLPNLHIESHNYIVLCSPLD